MPGHSFAVGFKYTMLCGSLVVRGAHNPHGAREEFEQWWQAGLRENEHYVISRKPDDLPELLTRAWPNGVFIGRRGADYTYQVLSPEFILTYWHALLTGYVSKPSLP